MTIHQLLQTQNLPLEEKEILLSHILKKDRSFLYAYPEKILTEKQIAPFEAMSRRRVKNEPLAYILGYKEFFGLEFLVNPSVLIPRAETEEIVEKALAYLKNLPNPTVADVGTGSGCIAIAIAKHLPKVKVFATDLSSGALALAEKNAKINNVSKRITFLKTNLIESIESELDLILANLPYIPKERYENLPEEIKNYEPKIALWSDDSPKKFYKELFLQSKSKLKPGGKILYEIDGKIFTKSF